MGDRIAIMSKGSLRCCGSPLYLKSMYSSGYSLVLTKTVKTSNQSNAVLNASGETETDVRTIALVKNLVPDAEVNENLASEISFVLPAEQSSRFGELFKQLDAQKSVLNVTNVGISISTLEDVFLK